MEDTKHAASPEDVCESAEHVAPALDARYTCTTPVRKYYKAMLAHDRTSGYSDQTIAWLAVQRRRPVEVAAALGLRTPSHRDATTLQSQGGAVYVVPPVRGWTLAFGPSLAFVESFTLDTPPNRRFADLLPFLQRVSQQLGIVQYFCTHRVSETHIWVSASGGRIARAFAYSGEQGQILLNAGDVTAEERQLGLPPAERIETADGPEEDDVIALAGMWSIDPAEALAAGVDASAAIIGDFG